MTSFPLHAIFKGKFLVMIWAFLLAVGAVSPDYGFYLLNSASAREEMPATNFQRAIIRALIYQDLQRLHSAFDFAGSELGAELAKTHKDIIQIKVDDLASLYKEKELKVDTAYKDKWLIVTGTISTLDKDITPPVLQIKGEMNPTTEVLAFFKNPEIELPLIASLELNQPITLMCHGVARTPSPTLQKCEFIETATKPLQDAFEKRLIEAVEGRGNLQKNAIWAFTILRIEELLGPRKAEICERSPKDCLKAIDEINPLHASKTIPKRFFELGYTEKMLISGQTGL